VLGWESSKQTKKKSPDPRPRHQEKKGKRTRTRFTRGWVGNGKKTQKKNEWSRQEKRVDEDEGGKNSKIKRMKRKRGGGAKGTNGLKTRFWGDKKKTNYGKKGKTQRKSENGEKKMRALWRQKS